MALTDHADIYAAIHDAGINRVIKHIMRQRPSLFNYGTANIQKNLNLLCKPLDVQSNVTQFITVLDPLPIIGVDNLGLDYCIQLTDLKFEFYPSNTVSLPGELSPLKAQHFAIKIQACAGLSCIPKEILKAIPLDPGIRKKLGTRRGTRTGLPRVTNVLMVKTLEAGGTNRAGYTTKTRNTAVGTAAHTALAGSLSYVNAANMNVVNPAIAGALLPGLYKIPDRIIIPREKLECFCLDVFVTGSAQITGSPPNQALHLSLDKIEVVNISPEGMENSIECYLYLALQRKILPEAIQGVSDLLFAPISLGDIGELQFSASTTAPNNPAIEDNQLKVHVNLDEITITLPEFGGDGDSGDKWPPPVTKYIKNRTRTDAYDLTTAVNEPTLQNVFQMVGNQFTWEISDRGDWGPFSAEYGVAVSVHDSSLELRSDHKMTVGFTVNVDTLYLNFGIDIPEFTIGGFCIIWLPIAGCVLRAPRKTFFSADPDITIPFDISGILSVALTFTAEPVFYYAEGTPNRWQLYVDPDPSLTYIDIDGIEDIPGTLFENAINAAIDSLGLPDWAEDVLEFIGSPLIALVKGILGITTSIAVWIIDFLGTQLGLWNLIKTALLEYIGSTVPLFQLEDPLPVIPEDTPEVAVKIPVSYLGATVHDTELELHGDIGGVS